MHSVARSHSVVEIAFEICQTLQRQGAFAHVAALRRMFRLHLITGLCSDTLHCTLARGPSCEHMHLETWTGNDAMQCNTSQHRRPWFYLMWHHCGERSLEVRAPCMGLLCLHAESVIFRVWEGDGTTWAGAGPKTSQVLDQVCLVPWQRLPATSLCQRAHVIFFERPTLRVGHPALGCNNHKANATLTTVWLHNNKIGDRGAVALAGAVQALLATVFFVSSTQSVLAVWS